MTKKDSTLAATVGGVISYTAQAGSLTKCSALVEAGVAVAA